DVRLTQSGTVLGTPLYMAPEQARGAKPDPRCDLFSLGVVLYRMCTGRLPFRGDTTMALLTALAVDAPTPPRAVNAALPPGLSDWVMQLLARGPARRPAWARGGADRLEPLQRQPAASAAESGAPAALPRPAAPRPRAGGRRRLLITAAAALLLLLP